MTVRLPVQLALILAATVLISACGERAQVKNDASAWRTDVEQWRATHDSDYRRDWVSVAGLYFLKPGPNTVGGDASNDIVPSKSLPPKIGRIVLDGASVRFEPEPGTPVQLRGETVTESVALRDDGQPESDELTVGGVRMVIHLSGDRRSLRVRDPEGEVAREFKGFMWFPVDEQYRVTARFIKDPQPQEKRVLNTMGDIDTYKTEGVAEFTLNGQTLRLRPFTTRPKRLYFVFRDASSGHETYETARFLYSDLQDDGTTVLDFNEAYNPPCSFNPYTTCPIPLAENRLPVKILAGEKQYAGHIDK